MYYYHLFSKAEYKNLNRFLTENSIDIAVWHMTTLKLKGRLHTPCPLVCLWHSTPVFHHGTVVFCEKYKVKPFVAKILKTKPINWLFVKSHDIFNVLAFTYVTARADKMVLLSEGFRKVFFPAKLFPKKVVAISNFLAKDLMETEVDWQQKRKEVLFMGRLDNKQKRVDLLLQVWSKIENDVSSWILNICVGGARRCHAKADERRLGLEECVFQGFCQAGRLL